MSNEVESICKKKKINYVLTLTPSRNFSGGMERKHVKTFE